MKMHIKHFLGAIILVAPIIAITSSCAEATANSKENKNVITETIAEEIPVNPTSEEFKKYWYAGEAEITSYELEQARYGEIRKGKAAMIFVTEDFLPDRQVKADNYGKSNIPVLKLNATKNFNTGIYPYSIMSSTFYPVANNANAIKVTTSMQEWCGQIYTQLNNREQYEIKAHSYFEGEEDKEFTLEKTKLENQIWQQIRIDPSMLSIGQTTMIPSFEYARLKHIEIKAYPAKTELDPGDDQTTYTITYPTLNRSLSINYKTVFPHEIISWEETFKSGFGPNAKELTTKATKIKSIKTPYWRQNANKFESMRTDLGLE
ncbi:septum formation inhibitor Maf [Spongiivirga citrea]|uniref:Septum formation inhibitor Maf n=1 Tax=Spongiivirga citrea TaxID=1481457 RepID=A0A6M0CI33_9FLAO|nr:septum formation inhibitor Maf [Spongiivirga citrea]NER15594.1 septum formation inhibitor Maf [Spongiivirga citrea]